MKAFTLLLGLGAAVASHPTTTITAFYDSNLPLNRRLHVRGVGAENKAGATPLKIRNAATAGANGRASVSGPCGGSATYTAAGAVEVAAGSKISLSLQYAAGHESANNVFTATFRCGAPTEGQMKEGTAGTTTLTAQDCTTTQGGTVYPVPAPTGRDAKIVECTLPAAVPADGGDCTLSLADQRDWGECVDIKMVAAAAPGGGGGGGGAGGGNGQVGGGGGGAAAPTPVAPTPPSVQITSSAIKAIVTSGPGVECCSITTGTITAQGGQATPQGSSTMTISGTLTSTKCDPALNYPNNQISAPINNVVLTGKVGEFAFNAADGAVSIGGVPAEVNFISNVLTFTMVPATEEIKVCDTEVTMGSGPPPAGSNPIQNGNTGNSNNNNNNNNNNGVNGSGDGLSQTAIIFIVIAVVCLLGSIAIVMTMNKRKNQQNYNNHQQKQQQLPTATTVALPSPAKTSGQFKSGWSEAQDAAGDTYYFNKITQETTWERHLVMV